MNEILLTESKKRIFTIPDGEYRGTWQDNFVWIRDENKRVFDRIETKKATKKRMEVKIIVDCPKFKVYGKRNL